ncbi:MAG: TonB-dependent siderophore receptor [Gemmatimonadota bacterium]
MRCPSPCRTCPALGALRSSACLVALLLTTPELGAQTPRPATDSTSKRTAATLQRVTVSDSVRRRRAYTVPRTSTATRTSALLRDVPQSATIISQALIADQGMQGMADVVRYVPGITMGLGEGHRDAPTIRGNSSTADFFIDGIRDDAQYYRDTYNVERVEALKGPNAMVFGRGGGGGILNRVTKDAQWTPTRALGMTGGSFEQRRATLDVGQGFGRVVAGRLNGLYENSASFRQASDNERIGINPTASLLLGRTMVRMGYEFYRDQRVVDRGIPSFQGAPATAAARTYFGDPDASNSALTAHALAATVDRQLWQGNASVDGLQLRNRTRFMTYEKFYQNVFPGAVNATAISVNLAGYNNGTDRQNLFNQTDLTTTITGGALRQTLLAGAEFGRQDSDNIRQTAYFGAPGSSATAFAVPFDAPMTRTPVTFRASATDADNRTVLTTQAVYAQNQVEVGPHVQAVLGLRYDRLNVDFTNNRNGQQLSRRDNLVSPRAGLVIKPAQPVSIYGSYSVSYLPSSGDQFASLTATSSTLEPEQFTNREVGIKWDAHRDLALTAAVYRLDRTNTTAPDPVTPSIIVQTGEQRTTGWELGISGAPTARWQVAGGYANQSARIVSQTAAARAGARVGLVPRNTLSLWNKVQVVKQIGAGIGIVRQDRMFAAIDNTVTLPAFTRVDGALFVAITGALRAQVNVENLLDTRYFSTAHSNNNIMPGSPRTFRVTLHVAP